MTNYDVKRLGLILSVQAEIEGMKAENELRIQNNESPAYGYSHFNEMATELSRLATEESLSEVFLHENANPGEWTQEQLINLCKEYNRLKSEE